MPLILGTNSIKDTGFNVSNSLRLDEPSNQGLTITPGSAGNRKTFTISIWVKRAKITNQTGDVQTIFESRASGSDNCAITFEVELSSSSSSALISKSPSASDLILIAESLN